MLKIYIVVRPSQLKSDAQHGKKETGLFMWTGTKQSLQVLLSLLNANSPKAVFKLICALWRRKEQV